jgi:hypothetical protein
METLGGVNMDGSLFYWILWSLWVYLTFIIDKKHPLRFGLSACILVIIILSEVHFTIGNYQIYASGVFTLVLSYIILSKEKNGPQLYAIICSIIVTIAYVTFRLYEIFDPVWLIFPKIWMMGIGLFVLGILLQNTLKGRLLVIICGTMHGEICYALFLNRFQYTYPIAALPYLDICVLATILFFVWNMLENSGALVQNQVRFSYKGKQKST